MVNNGVMTNAKRQLVWWAAIVSAVIIAFGLVLDFERGMANLLVGTFAVLTVALGGAVFVALTYVSGAGWHVAFRRVPEAMAMMLPAAGAAIVVVLAIQMQRYGWSVEEGEPGTFWMKQLWLTPTFWLARAVGYVVIWSLLATWLVARSRRQDQAPNPLRIFEGNVRISALFLAVYAVTFSLASVDWIMALEPMWFSTMWGVYGFSGMILAALAVVVILCVLLSAPGRSLHGVFREDHLHDLGKLLIGFSCFWMYIWFSQYMLIWYSNIPEETSYFVLRTHSAWGPLVVAMLIVNWGVPFFALLPKRSKRSPAFMLRIAVLLLIGRWLDLCIMIFPPILGDTPALGLWEVATLWCAGSVGLLMIDRAFRSARPVAEQDPYLGESLTYHSA